MAEMHPDPVITNVVSLTGAWVVQRSDHTLATLQGLFNGEGRVALRAWRS